MNRDRSRARRFALPALAVILVAINLRPAAVSVGPLLHRIQVGNDMSNAGASLLVTLPLLCFGLLAPVAPTLARRLGLGAAIGLAMSLLLAGQLIRLISGVGFLFLGTAVACSAIAIGNVLMPVMVRRDFAARTGPAMSAFSASLLGFAALAAGLTVPIADALGGGWRPGLGVWAVPAVLAALLWLPALARREGRSLPEDLGGAARLERSLDLRLLLRNRLAWQVTLFFGVQSGSFYATLAWLPSIFRSHGSSEAHAGVLLSVTLVVGVIMGLVVPGVAARLRDQRILVAGCCFLMAVGWMGILLAPTQGSYLWVVLLGLGQNASFPLALMLIVLRGGSVASTARLSTMAQSVGYGLAALAPFVIGAIHGWTHSWTPELLLMLALVVPQLLLGLGAARNRQLASAVSS